MKKYLIVLFISIITISLTTGCESKDLTSYVKENELKSGKTIAYIEMDKKKFKELATQEEFKNLMSYLKEQEYSYLVVSFGNNKGLYCLNPNCIYEKISKDTEGNYIPTAEIYGKIQKDDDGNYKYEKIDN